MQITYFPERRSNPVRWTQSPALYSVAIKAGLCRKAVRRWLYVTHLPGSVKNLISQSVKAVQMCYIPIPGDIYTIIIPTLLKKKAASGDIVNASIRSSVRPGTRTGICWGLLLHYSLYSVDYKWVLLTYCWVLFSHKKIPNKCLNVGMSVRHAISS